MYWGMKRHTGIVAASPKNHRLDLLSEIESNLYTVTLNLTYDGKETRWF